MSISMVTFIHRRLVNGSHWASAYQKFLSILHYRQDSIILQRPNSGAALAKMGVRKWRKAK